MKNALEETERRRTLQLKFNAEHNITPTTIQKAIRFGIESEVKARHTVASAIKATEDMVDQTEIVTLLEEEMIEAARNLEFERAAQLRDKINEMKGAPVIKSGNDLPLDAEAASQPKLWQPKTPRRGAKRVAK